MRMSLKDKIIRYVMLVASFFVMLAVILPHHHHEDGAPCYRSLASEEAEGEPEGCESHDCGDHGHTIAFFASIQLHVIDNDIHHFLFPLQTVFALIDEVKPTCMHLLFTHNSSLYVESLHSVWIRTVLGLRAPPSL